MLRTAEPRTTRELVVERAGGKRVVDQRAHISSLCQHRSPTLCVRNRLELTPVYMLLFCSDDEDDDFRAPSPISLAPSGYLAPQPTTSNRYGVSGSSKTIDADIPFANSAAPPAGHFSGAEGGGDYQHDYEFDSQPPREPPRRWWKNIDWDVRGIWRSRGKVEEGVTRTIVLNDPVANDTVGFERNSVSTGKYNVVTFIPIFLFGEFLAPFSPVEGKADICSLFLSRRAIQQGLKRLLPLHRFVSSSRPPLRSKIHIELIIAPSLFSDTQPSSNKSPESHQPVATPPSSLWVSFSLRPPSRRPRKTSSVRSPIERSTTVSPRSSSDLSSSTRPGSTSGSETSCDWRRTTSSPRISCC